MGVVCSPPQPFAALGGSAALPVAKIVRFASLWGAVVPAPFGGWRGCGYFSVRRSSVPSLCTALCADVFEVSVTDRPAVDVNIHTDLTLEPVSVGVAGAGTWCWCW